MVNERKFCFIFSVNNDEIFDIALQHVKQLIVPPEYFVDYIKVTGSLGLTNAYNTAMNSSNAKYKIYMHQDVLLLNRNFLNDLLQMFTNDGTLGMVGVVGARNLPRNGVWWESTEKVGTVLENRGLFGYLQFDHFFSRDTVAFVDVIDGLLMATQYDVPWREDLFDGWHFYDISQSLEFKRRGYRVGIPLQTAPWCLHFMGRNHRFDVDVYNFYREIFLRNYGEFIAVN